nr:MAG TPA: hypothetical protein [Caudoviricetes sp.]
MVMIIHLLFQVSLQVRVVFILTNSSKLLMNFS